MRLFSFFLTGSDAPPLTGDDEIRRLYTRKRREVFFMLLAGYGFYYVCRLALSVAKKPMIDAGIADTETLGRIGFAFFITYAIGKFTNGFLADRANVGRFISTGLLASGILSFAFGAVSSGAAMIVIWGLHGLFQAMGAAPSGVCISQWFSNRERGTRYAVWSVSHSVGEGVSMVVTAVVIFHFGWRCGFFAVGVLAVFMAFVAFRLLADRPQTYGLPAIADYRNDHPSTPEPPAPSVWAAQKIALSNPYVWILGVSSASMYIARYGVNSWGPMFLQDAKEYPLIAASMIFGWAKIVETAGTITSGVASDFLFQSRRNVVTLVYGLLFIGGLILFCFTPSTLVATLPAERAAQLTDGPVSESVQRLFAQANVALSGASSIAFAPGDETKNVPNVWTIRETASAPFWSGYCVTQRADGLRVAVRCRLGHVAGLAMFCFGLGGLLAFLGGLIALDITSKQGRGAALGLVGMISYAGAAIQDWVSGALIAASEHTDAAGITVRDFGPAIHFWIGAAIFSIALSCLLWNAKAKD